jgi:LEA14-like dessication related protein
MRRCSAVVLSLAAILLCGGCGTVQLWGNRPDIRSVAVAVDGLNMRTLDLRVDVEVVSRGWWSLTMAGYGVALAVEGLPLAKQAVDRRVILTPGEPTTLSIPVSIAWRDAFRQAAALVARGTLAYRLDVTLYLDTSLGVQDVPFHREGRLSLGGKRDTP